MTAGGRCDQQPSDQLVFLPKGVISGLYQLAVRASAHLGACQVSGPFLSYP